MRLNLDAQHSEEMMNETATVTDPVRHFLRHTVATLAYRAAKVLRDTPDGFASMHASPSTRTPLEVLTHLGDLMEWGERLARGEYRWQHTPMADWSEACDRFFQVVGELDAALAESPAASYPPAVIFQGPIADALTHVGQLAMLRGMANAPIRPESYARADIRVGGVGHEQPPAKAEFDGDASAPRS